jgi:phage gp16-like protein
MKRTRTAAAHGPTHAPQDKKKALAMVHVAKKDLRLDDDVYRNLLQDRFGVGSAKDLTPAQLGLLLDQFRQLGFKPSKKPTDVQTGRGTAPLLRKIEALLAAKGQDEGRFVPLSYAEGLLKKMTGVEKLAWATPEDLRKVVAALSVHNRRHGGRQS